MNPAPGRGKFATTHWSLVLAAARDEDRDGCRAMESLCEQYWYPLYVFVRRRGYAPDDAQDLTQAFFARLLEKGDVARASPARGRFRSFLLASLQNFLLNELDRVRALKRGGGVRISSIDMVDAEQRFVLEPATADTPDDHFNRRWALTLLDRGLHHTKLEYERGGNSALFGRLVGLMTAVNSDDSYREAAADLEMSEGAVKVAVHRMRRRFRDILRDLIGQTVDADELDDEIGFLIRAVGRRSSQP
jgi:DNA-directed RNA polymerase specialized sigma24 family protein